MNPQKIAVIRECNGGWIVIRGPANTDIFGMSDETYVAESVEKLTAIIHEHCESRSPLTPFGEAQKQAIEQRVKDFTV